MIEVRHLRKEYENATPLSDVNVTINDGDVISIIGPSGTGKSTFIRCLNMLERPTSGQILVNGTDITAPGFPLQKMRLKMGMVFQSFHLFGHLTVVENVMKPPMDLLGMPKQEAYDLAVKLLRRVGLENRLFNYPDELSGGQKQRVAIARTLSTDPDVILFDEPTSALDPTMVGEVQAVIRDLAGSGKTMLIVTHEMKFARRVCNRVFYMDKGGIYEDGTPEQIFEHPEGELTRRFIRQLKVFETRLTDRHFDFIGTVNDIASYGYKNQIPPKTVYRIQTLFEELCMGMLLPAADTPDVLFAVEYDENASVATVYIDHTGDVFDPRESEDILSAKLIENLADEILLSPSDTEGYTNRITVRIKG